mgnify:CR=1 FL=1
MLTVEIITRFERTFRFISDDSEYTEKLIELLKKIMKVCPKSNYVWSIWSENEKIQYKHINNTITYIYNPNCFREAVELFKDRKNSLQQCNTIARLFKCKATVDKIKKNTIRYLIVPIISYVSTMRCELERILSSTTYYPH